MAIGDCCFPKILKPFFFEWMYNFATFDDWRLSDLLVGGDWNMIFLCFHSVRIDYIIFFRGVGLNH